MTIKYERDFDKRHNIITTYFISYNPFLDHAA